MKKNERLEAIIRGEKPDRPGVALWRHWPGDDQRAEDLARAQIAFQRQFDFDFMKVTPASSFCLEDWGVRDRWVGHSDEGTREYLERPVKSPSDWSGLALLDPREGALGRQLRCLELIRGAVGDEVPFVQTVFSPLTQAKNLVGANVMAHLRRYPTEMRAGLDTITETTVRFVEEAVRKGADGIFYAVQEASYELMTEDEYCGWCRPYDLGILEAARAGWFNVLHLHGREVMFELVAGYPVQAVNWHDRETEPSLSEAVVLCDKVLIGGLGQVKTMLLGTPEDVRAEAKEAMEQTGGRRFILGTGCVTPITAPTSNLYASATPGIYLRTTMLSTYAPSG